MIDIDNWQEIGASLWQHKLRSIMIAILVSWGIFMLVFLLGAGKGLQNGVKRQFQGFATNSMWVWSWKTSIPYNGLPPGRQIQLTNDDFLQVQSQVKGIETMTPRIGFWGTLVNRKNKSGSYNVQGVSHEFYNISQVNLLKGRFLNLQDVNEKKKHVVIGRLVAENLFGAEDCIGQYVEIKGVNFKVIGVFSSPSLGEDAKEDEEEMHIPFSAAQQAFNFMNKIGTIILTVKDGYNAAEVENEVKAILRVNHKVDPKDDMAINSWSSAEQFQIFNGLFIGINGFIVFVAIGTIFAGMIAISVIMMITVKERTREIGVRKALGATPSSIILLIMQEALVVNIIAGIFGLIAGVFLIDSLGTFMQTMGFENEYFHKPEVDLSVALIALFVLIFSGLLAGLFPAVKAANIKPIEALRAD